jgi:hypothetical protein
MNGFIEACRFCFFLFFNPINPIYLVALYPSIQLAAQPLKKEIQQQRRLLQLLNQLNEVEADHRAQGISQEVMKINQKKRN